MLKTNLSEGKNKNHLKTVDDLRAEKLSSRLEKIQKLFHNNYEMARFAEQDFAKHTIN